MLENIYGESVSMYAKRKKITPQGVRKAIKEGRVLACKIGKSWLIPFSLSVGTGTSSDNTYANCSFEIISEKSELKQN